MTETTQKWSLMQQRIFEWFAKPGLFRGESLLVRARAGSGKTTTIVEGVNRAPEKRIWVAAFNADIAKVLSEKIRNPNASAKTLHGVGMACIMREWGDEARGLDKDRGYAIAEEVLEDGSLATSIPLPERLIGTAQELMGADGKPLPPTVDRGVIGCVAHLATRTKEVRPFARKREEVEEVGAKYDLLPDDRLESMGWSPERISAYALKAMQVAAEFKDRRFDFADMIFLPLVNGWTYPRFDMTVIDEAQDMSEPMLAFAQRMTKRGGRIVVVGDDKQSIYGFRGADSEALDRLKRELDAEELPLTITYRCPLSVVRDAQRLVADFEARPGAPEGVLRTIHRSKLAEELRPGDMVLSRVNAALMPICIELLRSRKPAVILGREFGESLSKLVRKVEKDCVPLEDFLESLSEWLSEKIEKLEESSERSAARKIELLIDQGEALRAIAESMQETGAGKDSFALVDQIRVLFSAGDKRLVVSCATVHKVKGLEAERVFVLKDTLYVYGKRRHDPEERNIEYVAITRAKAELVYVVDPEAQQKWGERSML